MPVAPYSKTRFASRAAAGTTGPCETYGEDLVIGGLTGALVGAVMDALRRENLERLANQGARPR